MTKNTSLIPAKHALYRKSFADYIVDVNDFTFDDMERLSNFIIGLTHDTSTPINTHAILEESLANYDIEMLELEENGRGAYISARNILKKHISKNKNILGNRQIKIVQGEFGAENLRYNKGHWAISLAKNGMVSTEITDRLQPVIRLAVWLQEEGLPRDEAQTRAAWLINTAVELGQDDDDYKILPSLLATERMRYAINRLDLSQRVSCDEWAKRLENAADRAFRRIELDINPQKKPELTAIGGFSGVGKSSVSRELAGDYGSTRPAIIIRSDAIRKQVWGLENLRDKLPPEAYRDKENNKKRQIEIYKRAKAALEAGFDVILDETHQADWQRKKTKDFAKSMNVRFNPYWLTADEKTLKERISNRKNDISDANKKILEMQLADAKKKQKVNWIHVDAKGTPAEIAKTIKALNTPISKNDAKNDRTIKP